MICVIIIPSCPSHFYFKIITYILTALYKVFLTNEPHDMLNITYFNYYFLLLLYKLIEIYKLTIANSLNMSYTKLTKTIK